MSKTKDASQTYLRFLNLVSAVEDGSFGRDRNSVRGIAFLDTSTEAGKVIATPAEPPIADLDRITPDWGIRSLRTVSRQRSPRHGRNGLRRPASSAHG